MMPDLTRNNLDRSGSPYLRQHQDNPVWWQEWNAETVAEAARLNRPLFVSVGYSTCHWCHVMATEAFTDAEAAAFLNAHFISIKVDREQRPDIDHFLMVFLTRQTGAGGWPLNAFLTPDGKPIYALTYAPVHPRGGMYGFLDIARQVYAYYQQHADDIDEFVPTASVPQTADEAGLIESLHDYFDPVCGGFGAEPKFPPHSTLLYLLYTLCVQDNANARTICRTTLDAMRRGGLSDHLQGGVFRYCVDRQWTIPHFEKMLYDQAMALWCYSLAWRVLGEASCRTMAEGIVHCLDDSFRRDGLFMTALDADTDHQEGATYLWRYDELAALLSAEEFERLRRVYKIDKAGNFDGAIHLVRQTDDPPGPLEATLLAVRRARPQPDTDAKILSGQNALTVAALIQAARMLGRADLNTQAADTMRRLLEVFWDGQTLSHSSFEGTVQRQAFLFDAAAALLAVTMLYEDDADWKTPMDGLAGYLETFRENAVWIESRAADFSAVPAAWFDHPIPSSAALAEMALARYRLLTVQAVEPVTYRQPFAADFYNIAAMMQNGLFHILTRETPVAWKDAAANTLQVRGRPPTDCYRGACRPIP